jgi:hypothetical protein
LPVDSQIDYIDSRVKVRASAKFFIHLYKDPELVNGMNRHHFTNQVFKKPFTRGFCTRIPSSFLDDKKQTFIGSKLKFCVVMGLE